VFRTTPVGTTTSAPAPTVARTESELWFEGYLRQRASPDGTTTSPTSVSASARILISIDDSRAVAEVKEFHTSGLAGSPERSPGFACDRLVLQGGTGSLDVRWCAALRFACGRNVAC